MYPIRALSYPVRCNSFQRIFNQKYHSLTHSQESQKVKFFAGIRFQNNVYGTYLCNQRRTFFTKIQFPSIDLADLSNLGTFFSGIGSIGLAVATGFGVYYGKEYIKRSEPAKCLGLTETKRFEYRDRKSQAEDYSKAKESIKIIGITGNHVLKEFILNKGSPNPLNQTIIDRLKDGVQVDIMIYSKETLEEINDEEKSSDLTSRERTIDMIKEIQKDNPKYKIEVKVLRGTPPFHGDLIDDKKAIIVPITREGIHLTPNPTHETYEGGVKIDYIKKEFEILWQKGKNINETTKD